MQLSLNSCGLSKNYKWSTAILMLCSDPGFSQEKENQITCTVFLDGKTKEIIVHKKTFSFYYHFSNLYTQNIVSTIHFPLFVLFLFFTPPFPQQINLSSKFKSSSTENHCAYLINNTTISSSELDQENYENHKSNIIC